jgi:hypothetical protein
LSPKGFADAGTLAAIVNAQVTSLELGRTTRTDEEGRFRFEGLEADNDTLRTTAADFTPLDKPIVVPGTTPSVYNGEVTASWFTSFYARSMAASGRTRCRALFVWRFGQPQADDAHWPAWAEALWLGADESPPTPVWHPPRP